MIRSLSVSWTLCLALSVGTTGAVELTSEQEQAMRAADIVILGEHHDNVAHHAGQGALMRQIEPSAVVFEMLTPNMAEVGAQVGVSDLAAFDAAVGWRAAGWPDPEIYQAVFDVMGAAAIVGAALPRASVRQAFAEGAAAVFKGDAARFGLSEPLSESQQVERTELQFNAHCEAMPRDMMGGMIEAQRLRDAHFADVALAALVRYGAPVVVITGHGHARKDWGMPYFMGRAAPQVSVFSVGFLEKPAQQDDPRFDVTVVTTGVSRSDPCAAFN